MFIYLVCPVRLKGSYASLDGGQTTHAVRHTVCSVLLKWFAFRLKGSYANLDGGQTTYALVDFTGGISERISLSEKRFNPGNLFELMYSVLKRSSMMGCEISTKVGYSTW